MVLRHCTLPCWGIYGWRLQLLGEWIVRCTGTFVQVLMLLFGKELISGGGVGVSPFSSAFFSAPLSWRLLLGEMYLKGGNARKGVARTWGVINVNPPDMP